MGLGLFLVPTLGGYWLLTHWNYTRYRAVRDSGYHVLFQSAISGGVLFVIAHSIIVSANYFLPQAASMWRSYMPGPYYDTALLSALLGFSLPVVGNLFYGSEKAVRLVAERNGDLIELLIEESIARRMSVELSLRSGKSYIGFALVSGIERRGESDVSLVPVASGYRNKDTQELIITTEYTDIINESLEPASDTMLEDFRVTIPMSEIVSARIFHPEVYTRFQESMDYDTE